MLSKHSLIQWAPHHSLLKTWTRKSRSLGRTVHEHNKARCPTVFWVGVALPVDLIPLKIQNHQRTNDELTQLVEVRLQALTADPKLRKECIGEMRRFLPAATMRGADIAGLQGASVKAACVMGFDRTTATTLAHCIAKDAHDLTCTDSTLQSMP
jgi:hypothetical protein